jgi:hypothetical protein
MPRILGESPLARSLCALQPARDEVRTVSLAPCPEDTCRTGPGEDPASHISTSNKMFQAYNLSAAEELTSKLVWVGVFGTKAWILPVHPLSHPGCL